MSVKTYIIRIAVSLTELGALDIVRLPVCSPTPYSRDSLNKRALGDFHFEFWQDSECPASAPDSDVEASPPKRRKSSILDDFTLVHRPKTPKAMPTFSETESESESSSEDQDFTLVHRPKLEHASPPAPEPSTSAGSNTEPVAHTSTDIKSEPSDEEDWDII